jgi:hypothetical protein
VSFEGHAEKVTLAPRSDSTREPSGICQGEVERHDL